MEILIINLVALGLVFIGIIYLIFTKPKKIIIIERNCKKIPKGVNLPTYLWEEIQKLVEQGGEMATVSSVVQGIIEKQVLR